MPAGEAPDWNGGYFTNDGQIITREDALACAEAMRRALADEPARRGRVIRHHSDDPWPNGSEITVDLSTTWAREHVSRYERYLRRGQCCMF
jgi:hypothetical protein